MDLRIFQIAHKQDSVPEDPGTTISYVASWGVSVRAGDDGVGGTGCLPSTYFYGYRYVTLCTRKGCDPNR